MYLTPNSTVSCGAVGDVGTHPSHGRRGLAKSLMALAEEYMRTHDIPVSMLHTGSAAPLYKSLGYETLPVRSTLLAVSASEVNGVGEEGGEVRLVNFDAEGDVAVLRKLHRHFAPSIRGTFERATDEYWKKWVGTSSDSRRKFVRVLFRGKDGSAGYLIADVMLSDMANGTDSSHPIHVTLREFFGGEIGVTAMGGVRPLDPKRLANVFRALLQGAFHEMGIDDRKVVLQFPMALLPDAVVDAMHGASEFAWLGRDRRSTQEELGWMLKLIHPFEVHDGQGAVRIETTDDLFREMKKGGGMERCAGTKEEDTEVCGFLKTDNF
ncbi:hypothetical protein HK104_007551 [Borealophlyctis nickersoniae]|nr:hypothetical protein HK104_007551 [Borealophlyctis nickersoniae]